jgi:crotonobetainyl-CoA:carnitine CoA-transferase CaiB-like acyl-CoA transferase
MPEDDVGSEVAPGRGSAPLSVRVLDLSGGIGAYCSKLLADLGADVLLVEPPAGDDLRRRPPFSRTSDGLSESLLFASYHANKRAVTLDYGRSEALPLLQALGRLCDVVIASPTGRRPLAGFALDERRLSWARSDAIVACITPFGLTGPARDLRMTPFTSFAMTGAMHRVGEGGGPPLAFPGRLAWDEAAIHAAFGVVAALEARDRMGGQLLDLATHEVGAAKDFLLERYDVAPVGDWGRAVGVGIPPTGVWECSDGPLAIAVHQEHHWQAFLAMLDDPPELSDPGYDNPLFRREVFDLMEQLIAPLMASHSRLDLFAKGQARGLPCAPYNRPGDYVADVQPQERGTFRDAGREGGPRIRIPWRWCGASGDLIELRRPAPALGQHNEEVYLGQLGYGAAELAAWKEYGIV